MAQSFFDDAEVPDHPDESDGASLSLGTRIRPNVDGTCTRIGWRFPNTTPSASVQVVGGLFRNSDSLLLGSKPFPLLSTPGQKNWVDLDTPIPLVAGVEYTAAVWSPDRYSASNGYLGADITRGDLTAVSNGGRFNEPAASLDFPVSSSAQSTYFVDFWFVPAGGTSPFTKDVAVSWRVLNPLTKDVAVNWRVLNGFTKDVLTSWRVLNGFSKDVSVAWNVLPASWVRDYAVAWRVLNAFSKDVSVRWRVLSNLAVPADITVNLAPQRVTARLEEDVTWDGR